MRDINELTGMIIGAAIEVHRALGPGLLESAYEACLAHEFTTLGLDFAQQVPMPVHYKGDDIDCGYRIDLLVEGRVIIELKAVHQVLPIHHAQLLTYLRLSGIRTGLILNFNTELMKDGVHRILNGFIE